MFSRHVSKSLLLGISFILLGVMLPECNGQTSTRSSKVPAATSLIQISMRPDALVYKDNARIDLEEFKIFKNTQAQLIKTPFVLAAALRKPEIASLSIYKQHEDNPVSWLQQNLEVSFPGDGEIMQVSLRDSNHREAVKLLRAVVHAYLSEVVETERSIIAHKLAALEEVLANKEQEIRKRRTMLKALAEELGSADPEMLKIQSQLAVRQLALYQRELFRVNSELRKLKIEREVTRAALKRLEKKAPPKASDGGASGARPEVRRVAEGMSALINQLGQVVVRLSDAELSQRLQNDLVGIQQQVNAWQQLLDARLTDFRRVELREKIADADVRIAITSENAAELEEQVDELKDEFQKIGQSSVELDMMQADLRNLEQVVKEIAQKRQALEVENKSRPRIRLLQRAEVSP